MTQSGAAIASGTLMGKIAASGKHIPYSNAAVDGSQAAVGILYNQLEAATGDIKAVIIARQAEVVSAALTGVDAAGTTDLNALGIYLR